MVESDLQTRFSRWLRYNVNFPIAYELKITKTGRLPFSRLMDHQKIALQKTKHGTLCYKIPDAGLGQKPFDGFCLSSCTSMVGIMFYKRGTKKVYLIDIDEFIIERDNSKSKSLTEKKAAELSWRVIEV